MSDAKRHPAVALLIVMGLLVPGCGSDDAPPPPVPQQGSTPTTGSALPNSPPKAQVKDPFRAGAAAAQRLTITVSDSGPGRFRYSAPPTVRGGLVEIRLRNDGEAPHRAQLWRIAGNHSVRQALRIRYPQPDWLRTAGGVGLIQPKATGRTLQLLRPGLHYVAGTLGQPGKVATIRVTAAPLRTGQRLPRAPARVDAREFTFEVSGLRRGLNTVEFRNPGGEQHHAFFAPMTDGAELADVRRFFAEQTSIGPPPVDGEGTRETVVLEGGERQVTQLDLDPGRYAVICFVRGRRGGPPHIERGMINELTVR